MKSSSETSLIWVLFWIFLLTAGDPDILDQIIRLLGSLVTYFGG